MGDISTLAEVGLTSEFIRFLNVQLIESRDEVQRLNEENAVLKDELERLRLIPHAGFVSAEHELVSLRKELTAARALAAVRKAEAEDWRIRYEELKPQLVSQTPVSATAQVLEVVRKQLVEFISREEVNVPIIGSEGQASWLSSTSQSSAASFCAYLAGLPGAVIPETHKQRPHAVFRCTRLPLLPKAAVKACVGGFCFFGPFLKWSAADSQHAYVVFPEYQYTPKPATDDATTWTRHSTEWLSLRGQQREVFYVDGENISYAGTFFCHAGPRMMKTSELHSELSSDEIFIEALARRTFHQDAKRPKAKARGKLHATLLAELYKEGTATVQMIGLQRVGFNDALFNILAKAYNKRDSIRVVSPNGQKDEEIKEGSQKRSWLEAEEQVADDEWRDALSGPSKAPRLDLDDTMDLDGTSIV